MVFYGKATKAKENTIIGEEKESVEMAYISAKMDKIEENITDEDLQRELDLSVGNAKTAVSTNSDGTLNVLFNDTKNKYNVNKGKVDKVEKSTNEDENIDWTEILADANENPEKYKHSEQETSQYIGIGTDGKPVNMDLWICQYSFAGNSGWFASAENGYALFNGAMGEGMWYSLGRAYLGTDFTNIIIPQYIKGIGDTEFLPVTSLTATFRDCTELVIGPEIPTTVKYMDCGDDCIGTFYGCTKLTTAPIIPDNVISLEGAFRKCTSLTGTITINANPNRFQLCFGGTILPIKLVGSASSTTLEGLKGTANNGNVTY